MAFRLARECGEWNVPKMLSQMPASLFQAWCRFYELEPWGTEVDFMRSAIVAQTMAACMGNKNTKLSQFMPKFSEPGPPKAKSNAELYAKFTEYAGLHNAKVGA